MRTLESEGWISNFLLWSNRNSRSRWPSRGSRTSTRSTIPTAVRRAAGISVGDLLDAVAQGRSVVLRPRSVAEQDAGAVAAAMGFKSVAALRKAVRKEAQANAEDDRRLTAEWSRIDEEAWQRHGD